MGNFTGSWPAPSRSAVARGMLSSGDVIALTDDRGVMWKIVDVSIPNERVVIREAGSGRELNMSFRGITDDWEFVTAKRVSMRDLMK